MAAEVIEKAMLSLAAEYAVASELCRRGVYTQLTLGNLKRTDLLAFTHGDEFAKLEVKAKRITGSRITGSSLAFCLIEKVTSGAVLLLGKKNASRNIAPFAFLR